MMKTKKKDFYYLGSMLLVAAIIGLFYFAPSINNTVDFRGKINEITFSEESGYTYITALMIFGTAPRVIRVGNNISIRNGIDGSRIQIDDLEVGDMIDLDVGGAWDNPTAIIIPRWIRVFPENLLVKYVDVEYIDFYETERYTTRNESIRVRGHLINACA